MFAMEEPPFNILIFGSNGWIGSMFAAFLTENNISFNVAKSRADNYNDVVCEIEKFKSSHVVSFIGRTHGPGYSTIDYLEQPGKLVQNLNDNLFAPLVLADICRQRGIHFTYLGTGCIFEYDSEHIMDETGRGFTENDLPNFTGSSYSTVKGITDRLMHMNSSVLNLRIRMPIVGEEHPRNFITKILNYEKICSIPNSMTVLPSLIPIVVDMMQNRTVGTVNLTNPGTITHNEILEMYRDIIDPKFQWTNFTQEEQRSIIASERSNNFLDTTLIETLYPNIDPIKIAVEKCIRQYKKTPINLLVTGGCGFIGSHFINARFRAKNINTLVNLDVMYYCASETNIDDDIQKNPRYTFVEGNICNTQLVQDVLKTHNITHVIHFAAQSHVQNSFENSIEFTMDNIVGTHTLLECCRKYGKIIRFVHVSTDEVYGESINSIKESHKTENSILCPTNPYAATKASAELIAQSYAHSYGMPIIISRGNNVYGKNQYPEKLIPRFIQLLENNEKVTIQGKGTSVRAFLHVSDTVSAFQYILEKGSIGEIYNIGCDENMEYSVMEVAKLLIRLIKNTQDYESWITYIEDRPFNDQRYYISNQKLRDLGWSIKVKFEDGISELVKDIK